MELHNSRHARRRHAEHSSEYISSAVCYVLYNKIRQRHGALVIPPLRIRRRIRGVCIRCSLDDCGAALRAGRPRSASAHTPIAHVPLAAAWSSMLPRVSSSWHPLREFARAGNSSAAAAVAASRGRRVSLVTPVNNASTSLLLNQCAQAMRVGGKSSLSVRRASNSIELRRTVKARSPRPVTKRSKSRAI